MADIQKEQQRDELHRAIWAIAGELRGAVDGWDFQNYVLGTMFYRYISENLTSYINQGEIDAGNPAFIMHSLSWLEANGTATIVCFPGILYRGGAEKKIRQYLVDNNFIDCIIQLPSNLFFGTSIATCIMVLKKNKADSRIRFINATEQCVKVTNKNRLTPENFQAIVDTYVSREEMTHFAHTAEYAEVAAQDYTLSVSSYVEMQDQLEVIDINALNAQIAQIVAREEVLRAEIDKIIRGIEG